MSVNIWLINTPKVALLNFLIKNVEIFKLSAVKKKAKNNLNKSPKTTLTP